MTVTELVRPLYGSFDADAAWAALVSHQVAGLHHLVEPGSRFTRFVEVDGDHFLAVLSLDPAGVIIESPTADAGVITQLTARVRHWFDLDADLPTINSHLSQDTLFRAQIEERPGLRVTRFQVPFEAVVLTVLGQQVSLARARIFGGRLLSTFGAEVYPNEWGLRRFPSPQELVTVPVEELRAAIRLTGRRAQTVHDVAELFADLGTPHLLPPADVLTEVSGIGPWTINYLAVRAGANADSFPYGDAVLRRALTPIPLAEQSERIASWSPYRSYAALRLWASA